MIFCLSQLHTGTWTTIAWLALHDQVRGLMLSSDVFDVLQGKPVQDKLQESGLYHQEFHRSMVYHEHIRPDHWSENRMCRTQLIMARTNPTVIPIRDPLLSLISYQHRAEIKGKDDSDDFLPFGHVLDRWIMMAEVFGILKDHVQFICWDLLDGNVTDRLSEVTKGLGLNQSPCLEVEIENNSMGDYPLKTAYQDGDVDALEDGVLWGDGLHELKIRESSLRPVLEELGYSDLLWWS